MVKSEIVDESVCDGIKFTKQTIDELNYKQSVKITCTRFNYKARAKKVKQKRQTKRKVTKPETGVGKKIQSQQNGNCGQF